jgi:hypothetical protein
MSIESGLMEMNRRDAMSAARHSRNRTRTTDRKIEDRKMKYNPIFLSSIFLSWCLQSAPLPKVSSQPANNFDYCSAEKRARMRGPKPIIFQRQTFLWLGLVSLRVHRVSAV